MSDVLVLSAADCRLVTVRRFPKSQVPSVFEVSSSDIGLVSTRSFDPVVPLTVAESDELKNPSES